MTRWIMTLFCLMASHPLLAQSYIIGESGWQLERLPDEIVLLRADIQQFEASGRLLREGLLIMSCERQARRIRFQIGDKPQGASTQSSELGWALLRGWQIHDPLVMRSARPKVRFFEDGSFEFLEAIGFSDSLMRDFLQTLQKVPNRLEIVLFKGPETGAFLRGVAHNFHLVRLEEGLGNIYGFEGLCFRPKR